MFHNPIRTEWIKPGRTRELLDNVIHVSVELDALTTLVPGGFITDGASVPKFLWSLYDPFGILLPAAIVHDYHYVMRQITKERADRLFREIVRSETEIGSVGEWATYRGVRRFGNGGDEWELGVPKSQNPGRPDFR